MAIKLFFIHFYHLFTGVNMKTLNWLIIGYLFAILSAHAGQNDSVLMEQEFKTILSSSYLKNLPYNFRDYTFDATQSSPLNLAQESADLYGLEIGNFKLNKNFSNGFFVYKLDNKINPSLLLPTPTSLQSSTAHSLYAHLLSRLVQHFFIDLAGGSGQNATNYSPHLNSTSLYKNVYGNNNYSKNWFASATALFNHTWKEFVFNTNLTALHAEANPDPSAIYFSPLLNASLLGIDGQKKISFLQENAEISYQGHPFFHPFIDGGLLQMLSVGSAQQASFGFMGPLSTLNFDSSAYKLGGGLAFNYKQYVLRLEQHYYQRGNLYHSNQSTLSFKINLS